MKDLLEIIIITYNREKNLSETLNKILSESSPVKDCKITILDNNSTDGTKDLCKSLISKFPNIIYFKNNFNVGLSGNILKAMEIPTEKYFWLLCDNDEINFENWYEVESAMKNDCDLIVIANSFEQYCKAAKNYESPYIKYLQCLLCSAAIYKTENITDEVMTLANLISYTIAPHMALVFDILNANKNVIETKPIISQNDNEAEDYSVNRIKYKDGSCTKNIVREIENNAPVLALSTFLRMIKDNNIRKDFKYLVTEVMPYFHPKHTFNNYKDGKFNIFSMSGYLMLRSKLRFFVENFIEVIFRVDVFTRYYYTKLRKKMFCCKNLDKL